MAEHGREPKNGKVPPPKKQQRWPAWLRGLITGKLFWGVMALGAQFFDAFEAGFPPWFQVLDLPDILGSICKVLAYPIAIGGWLFIWGDGRLPFQWINSPAFNIAFGLLFYGLVGALIGRAIGKRRNKGSG